MADFLMQHYLWLKALHIISVISWMAGMLYLPRLYVYHADAKKDGELSNTLKTMERRLLRYIMNPAMIAAFVFGGLMLWANPALFSEPWMHTKLLAIAILTGVHHVYAAWRKRFERDENTKDAKFFRIWNEVPTMLMIIIVFVAVAKPF